MSGMNNKTPAVKVPTSFRMTKEGYELMQRLAKRLGMGRAAILEFAIRRLAQEVGAK